MMDEDGVPAPHDAVGTERGAARPGDGPEVRLLLEWLARCMDSETRWLDVGCGRGDVLSRFPHVERGGIDRSSASLARARAANPGAVFRQGDVGSDLPDWFDRWDLVSSSGRAWSRVASLREVEQVAENMARWTAPTGTLVIHPHDVTDLTGPVAPTNFSGAPAAAGTMEVAAVIWTEHGEGGRSQSAVVPSVDTWVRWLSRWFHRVEVHTVSGESGLPATHRRLVVARGKRQPEELSLATVVLHPHPDAPEGTPPHAFDSGVRPEPLDPRGGPDRLALLRAGVRRGAGRVRRRLGDEIAMRRSRPSDAEVASSPARPEPPAAPEDEVGSGEAISISVGPLSFDAVAHGPPGGEPVLLLHGYPESSWQWRFVQPLLSEAGFRSVAPDLRGYSPGASPTDPAAYSADHLVADVIGFADHLGWDRFHLVGHDWGGGVAWHVAGRHPDRLLTLSVLSTPHPAAFADAERAGPQADGEDQALLTAYMRELAQPGHAHALLADGGQVMRATLRAGGMPEDAIEHYMGLVADPERLATRLHWYSGFDFADASALGPITTPTLYVWSTDDPVLGRLAAETTERHVAGPYRFEVLDGVGHLISEEVPEVCADLLLRHLAR